MYLALTAHLCVVALLLFIGNLSLSTATHDARCTYPLAVYSTRMIYYQTSYVSGSDYACGFLWLGRCRRTRTSYRMTSGQQTVVNYVSASRCCPNYSGVYPNCRPICNPTCVRGTCSHPNVCSCNAGWTGSTCNTDICECCLNTDECAQNCHNTVGSYTCSCNNGYTLDTNGRTCTDVNECLTNNGGCHQQCTNTVGSFICSCFIGYEFNSTGDYCINIDECERGLAGCNHNCTDTIGSFKCSCLPGYQLQSDDRTCEDINECSNDTYHSCAQNCHNTIGSHYCSCNDGYNLHENEQNCTDIDECEEGIHGCNHHCNNTIGGFNCTCFIGYHLSDNNRTCNDTNECLKNNGGCQHNCINSIGSYYCSCRDGYTLGDDGASCTADPCTTIFAPINGYMSCNGPQVTDTICGFSCEPGYNLTGPAIRYCQPNHTWSDTLTTCPPLQCPHLSTTYDDEDHVFVLAPCHNTYNFTCSLLCREGYHLNGTDEWEQTCDLIEGSNDAVKWTKEPLCLESTACSPNPCSVGVCSIGADTLFTCDCRGTLRRGDQCEIGTVKVDPVPITTGGQFTLTYRSTPSNSITVVIKYSQNHFKGKNTVTITAPLNQSYSNININDQTSGLFTIQHTLQGKDLNEIIYDKPEDSVLLITGVPSTPSSNYFTANNIQSPLLSSGCCWYNYHFQSPTPSCLRQIVFTSSCAWTDSTSFIGTNGIVFLWKESDMHLPVSIGGISHSLGEGNFKLNMPGFSNQPQCSDCNSCPNCTTNCTQNNYPVNTHDISQMLTKRSLLSTFFTSVSSFFPSWLSVQVNAAVHVTGYQLFDYSAFVGSAIEAAKLYGCEKLPYSPTNLIYTVRSSTNMTVIMSSNQLDFPSNHIDYIHRDNVPICYALDICAGHSSKLYVGVPESLAEFISSFQTFQDFITKGWLFEYEYLSFAEFGFPFEFTGQAFWNGSEYIYSTNNETSYDYQIKLSRLYGPLIGGNLNGTFKFSGLLMHQRVMITDYQTPSLLVGTFNIILTTKVGQDDVSLYLSSDDSKMALTGSSNSFISQGGATARLNYRLVPYDSATFFANLFIIPDYTSYCPIDLYIQATHFHDIDWITLTSSCLGFRVGHLEFLSNMNNVVTFYGVNNDNMVTILTESTLTVNEKQFGRHVLQINTPDSPSLTLKYMSTTNDVQGTLYSTNVSVFDSVMHTDISIAGSILTFSGVTTIFDHYLVSILGSFTSDKKWDTTPFLLIGTFLDADFTTELNSYVYNYLNNTADTAKEKRANALKSIENAKQLLSSIERIRNTTLEELKNATEDYDRALSQVTFWNMTVNQTLQNYTAGLSQYISDMNMIEALTNCSLRTCDDVCVMGTNCTTCYKDTTTIETGSCPTYQVVTRTLKQEIPYLATGWRYELRSYWCRDFRRVSYSCQVSLQTCFRAECVSYIQRKIQYVQQTYTVLELQERPCVVEQYNVSSPSECCQVYPCSYTVPDPTCLAQKESCLEQIQQIQGQQSNLANLYSLYLTAQQSLIAANVELTEKVVDLETVKQALNLIQPAYESAKANLETSLANYNAIREETNELFKLVEKLNSNGGDPSQLIQVQNITFSQTIISETPFVFPVEIFYETLYSGQTYTVTYSMNFVAPQEIIRRSIAEDLLNHFLENSAGKRRKREATQVNANTIYRQFQLRCTDLQNVKSYFDRLISLLNDTMDNIENIRNRVLEASNSTSLNDILQDTTSNITDEYIQFYNKHNESILNIVHLIESNGFSKWQTTVEMFHNRTDSVGGHKCFGLTDCLETSLTLLETLLSDIPGNEAKNILQYLMNVKVSIVAIGYQNHTLNEAMSKLTTASQLAYSTDRLGYWCSTPPVITINPPLEINITMGHDLILECGATSSLPIQYRWKKDRLYLSNQRSNILHLKSMQLINAGDYICEVSSAVGSTGALSTRVNVYYVPVMNLTLSNAQTIEGNDDGVNFACDAHSWPPPGWTWYFRPVNQSIWHKIEGIDANVLPLIDPRVEQEGWYKCEASNSMGNMSSTAYLTVLPVSIVRIMYPGQFIIAKSIMSSLSTDGSGSGSGSISMGQLIDDVLTSYLKLQIVEIANVIVSPIDDKSSTVSFILTTPFMDMDSTDIVPLKVEDILAETAFPMITELESAKLALENAFGLNNTIKIQDLSKMVADDEEVDYETVPESLQYSIRAFVCPNGFGLDAGLVFCVSCAPGTYQGPPAIVMTNIGDNRFIQEEQPQCLACPIGSYQSTKGTTQCTGCLEYMTTANEGSNDISACIGMCEPMTYSMTGLKPCQPCPEDYYQLNYGGVGCIACNGSTTIEQCIKTTQPTQENVNTNTVIVIASSVAGGILAFIIVISIIVIIGYICRRQQKSKQCKREPTTGSFFPNAKPHEYQYSEDMILRLEEMNEQDEPEYAQVDELVKGVIIHKMTEGEMETELT